MFKHRMLAIVIAVGMVISLLPSALAIESLDEIERYALGTPSQFGYDYQWSISKTTTLYDTNEEIVAYCFDLRNQNYDVYDEVNYNEIPETSYVIVGLNDRIDHILAFGVFGVSPYFALSNDMNYYLGTMNYYSQKDGIIIDLTTGDEVEYSVLVEVDESNKRAIDAAIISNLSSSSSENDAVDSISSTDYNFLSAVPSLQWSLGCAPTSVAMLIKTKYPLFNSTTMISSLASYMGTVSGGSTSQPNIPSGTLNYCTHTSNVATPSVCNWACPKSTGYPYTGFTYNSKSTYKSSIDGGFPVGVYISSSTVTTSGYSHGFGAHMMAGIGYYYGAYGDFIICYTTNTDDGAVYFPMTSTGLTNNAWFLLKW